MAEAQATFDRSSDKYRDLEGQTRQLFNYVIGEDTKADGPRRRLNAKAFEEREELAAKLLFNPDTMFFDSLAGNLLKYAEPMRNDPELQRKVAQLRGNLTFEGLVKMSKIIFNKIGDIWTAILTLFVFGLELCRQMVIDLYDTIADAITSVIIQVGADWILERGGWSVVLSAAPSGWSTWLSSMAKGVTSWFMGSSRAVTKD